MVRSLGRPKSKGAEERKRPAGRGEREGNAAQAGMEGVALWAQAKRERGKREWEW